MYLLEILPKIVHDRKKPEIMRNDGRPTKTWCHTILNLFFAKKNHAIFRDFDFFLYLRKILVMNNLNSDVLDLTRIWYFPNGKFPCIWNIRWYHGIISQMRQLHSHIHFWSVWKVYKYIVLTRLLEHSSFLYLSTRNCLVYKYIIFI